MRRRTKWTKILVVVALAGVAFYLGSRWLTSTDDDDDQALVFDRTWMTEVPERETDFLHGLVVLRAHPYGAFYKASSWRMEQEVFEYRTSDQTFDIRFPQSGRQAKLSTSVRRCDDHPPFDLCLTLDQNPWGGPTSFYGFLDDEEEEAMQGRHGRARTALLRLLEGR